MSTDDPSYRLSDYDFTFPSELIAHRTAGKGNTRILHCPRNGDAPRIIPSRDIVDLFRAGDCLVVNNTKVIPARLFGQTPNGGAVEVLLVQAMPPAETGEARWEAWVRPGRAFKAGRELTVASLRCTVESITAAGPRILRFAASPAEFQQVIEREGHIPLPPYIERPDDVSDREDYQTVFAKHAGAIAAPTASLHFNNEMLAALRAKGVQIAEVTLHVGPGTFSNISSEDDFREHQMHGEVYHIDEADAARINQCKENGGRIICVGTTSTRVLETVATPAGRVMPGTGVTHAFIYPGIAFKVVDGLLTNFHWPKSSLILLVSAFYGKDRTLAAYRTAVQNGLQLFSYGDGMLII